MLTDIIESQHLKIPKEYDSERKLAILVSWRHPKSVWVGLLLTENLEVE